MIKNKKKIVVKNEEARNEQTKDLKNVEAQCESVKPKFPPSPLKCLCANVQKTSSFNLQ